MTLDDLVKVFTIAHLGADNGPADKTNVRAGIRAVVTAMKREIVSTIRDGESWPWTSCDADDFFDEILAQSENDKAAGGPTSDDGPGEFILASVSTPAADPEVCVWTRTDESGFAHKHGWTGQYAFGHEPPTHCHRCGLPIRFEAVKP